ncbi:S1 RNA-binding domain-containing protein [Streptomyces sp. NPDC049590]|uniref:S1 RNA-binding domain-containing protein n=1 Tax=Streptomyces sp. NPDC049590 TaxID=3154834 RepID=UPI00343D72F1
MNNRLEPGDIRKGTVTSVEDFGAYVDTDGHEGLIPLLELSWRPFRHPSEILQSGQKVTVLVIDVNKERGSISLSLKALEPDPLLAFSQEMLGESTRGRVTRLTPLGAFVEVADGLEGLLLPTPGSERGDQASLKSGDEIQVTVARVNVHNRRIALLES